MLAFDIRNKRILTLRFWCNVVDAVALIVQIHLQMNRLDLALKEVKAARRWAQDSLLVNLAESWVGLRVVCFSLPASGYFFKIVNCQNKERLIVK